MTDYGERFKRKLRTFGLSDSVIVAAWPSWWSSEADASASARNELRFSIARKLGLDPRSLLDESDRPQFVWKDDEARFKNIATESSVEKAAIASIGMSVGRLLLDATPEPTSIGNLTAGNLRNSILASQPFVRLVDLLAFCWAVGIPVIHMRVFPFGAKRMYAMAVRIKERHAILLAKNSLYPAWIAHYLAHEIGHIVLGHLVGEAVLVDLGDEVPPTQDDDQEAEADRFALEVLTGSPDPHVLSTSRRVGARQLGVHALKVSEALRIEPGTLSLCLGFTTGKWEKANGSLKHIYRSAKPVWREVNQLAHTQLHLDQISEDARHFLTAVLGGNESPSR